MKLPIFTTKAKEENPKKEAKSQKNTTFLPLLNTSSSSLNVEQQAERQLKELEEANKLQQKKLKNAFKKKAPKSVQDSIRYDRMFEDGICEVAPGVYSKTLQFSDINYQIAKREQQVDIFTKYCECLNYFDSSISFQIQVVNRYINEDQFKEKMLLKRQNDGLDDFRDEENQMLLQRAIEGQNSVVRDKFFSFSVYSENYEAAVAQLSRIETDISSKFRDLGCTVKSLNGKERLAIIYDMFNPSEIFEFDYKDLLHNGLTTKDIISPNSFDFSHKNFFRTEEKFCQTLFVKDLPPEISDQLIADLTDISCNLNISIHLQAVEQDKALDYVKTKLAFMEQQKLDELNRPANKNFLVEMISPELKFALKEAEELLDDLQNKNQRMFKATILINTSANSIEELTSNVYKIISTARQKNCKVAPLSYQQENAMNSCLPLGVNHIPIQRTLTTASVAIFIPFTTQELFDEGGINYGLNARSRNLVFVNRRKNQNSNGWILGTPGSGKSVSAKTEIKNVLIGSDDDVIVIDPEGEYSPLAKALGGEVIKISANSSSHINPMDINLKYNDKNNPLTLKTDFILSLCETVLGGKDGLSSAKRSLIDRACRMVYKDFFSLKKNKHNPTLKDFFNTLKAMPEPAAQTLALDLELYIEGSLSTFAKETNVDVNNRFIVFDIKDLETTLKTMGMLVVLDQIWNRITQNRAVGKRTWVYIDEIYLLFSNEYSADYLFKLWKRARKWGAIPTGITQNVEDLLLSDTARRMLSNSEFCLILNQQTNDRLPLSELLCISPQQLNYITNAPSGQGLIISFGAIVPFINKIPTDSKIYKLITTKIDEVEIEKNEDRRNN